MAFKLSDGDLYKLTRESKADAFASFASSFASAAAVAWELVNVVAMEENGENIEFVGRRLVDAELIVAYQLPQAAFSSILQEPSEFLGRLSFTTQVKIETDLGYDVELRASRLGAVDGPAPTPSTPSSPPAGSLTKLSTNPDFEKSDSVQILVLFFLCSAAALGLLILLLRQGLKSAAMTLKAHVKSRRARLQDKKAVKETSSWEGRMELEQGPAHGVEEDGPIVVEEVRIAEHAVPRRQEHTALGGEDDATNDDTGARFYSPGNSCGAEVPATAHMTSRRARLQENKAVKETSSSEGRMEALEKIVMELQQGPALGVEEDGPIVVDEVRIAEHAVPRRQEHTACHGLLSLACCHAGDSKPDK